ncbi:beta-lactamase family protein [Mycobacterium sp. Y57]|uniref:serine hydrolase domain-containing protein n=1 Tax=Mycolicibacterium xanthum TaxID=2796469 RepID=UPI001C855A62|nr:serine hydrolase domain-containing protein [Mycolicibacterium xanthum]MBX7434533.1 beta-lactamase family protein [Mycolicibacterium xanthum]
MTPRPVFAALAAISVLAGCAGPADEVETVTSSSSSTGPEPAATMGADLTGRLDDAVDRVMSETAIPGAIVGIWGPDGEYVRAFGVADTKTRDPMKTGFYSRIGSLTKTFTVTAVLQLADQGKVGLDDPIADYVDGVPRGREITLRQLAGMRSGLANYTANPEFEHAMFADARRPFTPQELLGYAFSQPASFAPGDGLQYSNTNTVLLGLVVEKVGGRPLGEFIAEHILAPLQMTDTLFPTDSAFPKPHAEGYTTQTAEGGETTATDWNPSWAWAAGAMISTLDDLRIWAPALATGRLLTRQMQEQRLQTVGTPGMPAPDGYGLGLFELGGWIGHNGSLPGYQTVAVYLPEKQTTLVILINTDISVEKGEPATLLATAITTELTPDHVYRLG